MSIPETPAAILTFTVGSQAYAVPVEAVAHLSNLVTITPLPGGPDYLRGVLQFRGEVLPVIDLRLRFGLPPQADTMTTPLIVIKQANVALVLLTDTIRDVQALQPGQLQPADSLLASLDSAELSGTLLTSLHGMVQTDELILLLNPQHLFNAAEHRTLTEAVAEWADAHPPTDP